MSTATLPQPTQAVNRSPSPIVSQAEILAAVASGAMTIEKASALLASFTPPKTPPRVQARRTAKGAMWLSLGYRAEAGKQNSCTLPKEGWESIVRLVKDGTIPKLLAEYGNIPLSANAQGKDVA